MSNSKLDEIHMRIANEFGLDSYDSFAMQHPELHRLINEAIEADALHNILEYIARIIHSIRLKQSYTDEQFVEIERIIMLSRKDKNSV